MVGRVKLHGELISGMSKSDVGRVELLSGLISGTTAMKGSSMRGAQIAPKEKIT